MTTTLVFAVLLLPLGRRRRLKTLLGLATLIVVAFCGVGCGSAGGSSSSAQKGVYVLSITGSSIGVNAKTTPLVVNVQ